MTTKTLNMNKSFLLALSLLTFTMVNSTLPAQTLNPSGDSFQKNSVWVNSIGQVNMRLLKDKFTVVMITDMNCVECGYYAKSIEKLTEHTLVVQLLQVMKANQEHPYSRSRINNYIQQYSFTHPIGILPDFENFKHSNISELPYFIVYDKSDIPLFSSGGIVGFERVIAKIKELLASKSTMKNYSSYGILPEVQVTQWANPIIEMPSYLAEDQSTGIYVNDAAHNRIVDLSKSGQCISIDGSSILPGYDGEEEGGVRLQNARGILAYNGLLYVADTYNNRLREVNNELLTSRTIVGNGSLDSLGLPTDVVAWKRKLYVADAFHNQILQVDVSKKKSKIFASLPVKSDELVRVYPMNLSVGTRGLYVVMSNGEVLLLDKKGKAKEISNSEKIPFSAVEEWKGGLAGCSPDRNAIYFKKKDHWNLLTDGKDEHSISVGVPPLNRPFDMAVIGGELYISDTENHIIRVIHSEKESVAHPFPMQLSEMLISEEPAHTFGQPVMVEEPILVGKKPTTVRVKLNLQGYQIVEGGKNIFLMHYDSIVGEVLNETISRDELNFIIYPNPQEETVYTECYLTLARPETPWLQIIKRTYLVFSIENRDDAEAIQEFEYSPDLLPH